jgi:hypothetical protein
MSRQSQALSSGQRFWWVRLSRPPRSAVLAVILILGAGVLWLDAVAPPVVGLAVTVAMAAAWCRWLERHTETSAFAETDAPTARAGFFVP